jgi:CBS domain-containing protein
VIAVATIMTRHPACCTPEAPLEEAARLMLECDCGEIPVVADLASMIPLGVITDRDITCRSIAEGRNPLELRVLDCMTSPALTCTSEMSVEECLQLLEANRIRRILVVERSGRLCGIVAQADMADALSPEQSGELLRELSRRTHSRPSPR